MTRSPSDPSPLKWTCRECGDLYDPYWHGDKRPHCSIECARIERLRHAAEWRAAHPLLPPKPKPPKPPRPRRPTPPGGWPRNKTARNAAVVRAVLAGVAVTDVAEQFGISRTRVYDIVSKASKAVIAANRPAPPPSSHYRPRPRLPQSIDELFDWQPAYVAGVLDAVASLA